MKDFYSENVDVFIPDEKECCPPPEHEHHHHHHPYHPMKPVPSVIRGQDLYECMQNLSDKVNVCISTYNNVMANCYQTLNDIRCAAKQTGSFYADDVVKTERGYDSELQSYYTVIRRKPVDKHGRPIKIRLRTAYDNSTNAKISENIYSASAQTVADKMFVAMPKDEENGYFGHVIVKGIPYASSDVKKGYTLAITKRGVMQAYKSSDVTTDQLIANGIEYAIGCSGLSVQNGVSLTNELRQIPNYDTKQARILIGQNYTTGEIVVLCVNKNVGENPSNGMTSKEAGQFIIKFGAQIAFELAQGDSCACLDKGSEVMPLGESADSGMAFFYWSKKKYYDNDYQDELADLTLKYGEMADKEAVKFAQLEEDIVSKYNEVVGKIEEEVERATSSEKQLEQKIKDEEQRATTAEGALDTKITNEISRATQEENSIKESVSTLTEKIDDETTRAKAAEKDLETKINSEKTRATAQEQVLKDKINTEQNRAEQAEATLTAAVSAEESRATSAEDELESKITIEKNRADTAEKVLQNNIDTEAARAKAEEESIKNSISSEVEKAIAEQVESINQNIDDQISTLTASITKTNKDLSAEINRAKTKENDLSSRIDTLETSVTSMTNDITDIASSVATVQSNLNTLSGNVSNLSSELATLSASIPDLIKAELDKLDLKDYVKKTGDTMTGRLNINVDGDAFNAGSDTVSIGIVKKENYPVGHIQAGYAVRVSRQDSGAKWVNDDVIITGGKNAPTMVAAPVMHTEKMTIYKYQSDNLGGSDYTYPEIKNKDNNNIQVSFPGKAVFTHNPTKGREIDVLEVSQENILAHAPIVSSALNIRANRIFNGDHYDQALLFDNNHPHLGEIGTVFLTTDDYRPYSKSKTAYISGITNEIWSNPKNALSNFDEPTRYTRFVNMTTIHIIISEESTPNGGILIIPPKCCYIDYNDVTGIHIVPDNVVYGTFSDSSAKLTAISWKTATRIEAENYLSTCKTPFVGGFVGIYPNN